MPQSILIKRAAVSTPVAMPAFGPAGEMAFARGGFTDLPVYTAPSNDLIISDGTSNQTLIGPTRQVETSGDQEIRGVKTFLDTIILNNLDPMPTFVFTIQGKDAVAGSNEQGQGVYLRAGNSDGSALGASNLSLFGGNGGDTSNGGYVAIEGGKGGAISGLSGNVTIKGGDASAVSAGGNVGIYGGEGIDANGGNVRIFGGITSGTTGIGGDVELQSGNGPTGRGFIRLVDLDVVPPAITDAIWNNNGILMIGAGGTLPPSVFPADPVTIAAGVDDTMFVSSLGLRSQMGDDAANLVTNVKTVVPAINEIYNTIAQLSGVVIFAGSYDATAGTATFNGQGGIAAGTGPLPVADTTNTGAYLIATVAGPGGGVNEPLYAIEIGDWLISDGDTWSLLAFAQQGGAGATFFDPLTFVGDGLTLATQIAITNIDGGTF